MTANFITGADLFGAWQADMKRSEPPARYSLPMPFERLDVRPGRLILLGGPPGGGKTAALLQVAVEMLRMNDAARVLIANVEMAPALLVERIVSRLSAVPLSTIADRKLNGDEAARLDVAVNTVRPCADRLAFLNPPFALEHVAAVGDEFQANVIVLDYIQRFSFGEGKGDKRAELESAANVIRGFCGEGIAVLAAAAVARQKNARGSTYGGLGLASFRGSSELEYGADAAYLLDYNRDNMAAIFRCEKNRYGAVENLATRFDASTQTFKPAPEGWAAFDTATVAPPRRRAGKGVEPSTN